MPNTLEKPTIFNARAAKFAAPLLGLGAVMYAPSAFAQVSDETAFVFNTFSFLVCGVLVMWMAAGFAMLEAGMVRTKNVATICLKNIVLYSIAGIMFYLIGYDLMYTDVNGFIGSFQLFYNTSGDELSLLGGDEAAAAAALPGVVGNGYSVMSDWFFQMVFVATAASIVSGTLAERIKFWPFMIFVIVLTGFLYPIASSWTWGGGFLAEMGFSDFAGSSIVHGFGAGAALAGAIVLGARKGKYGPTGAVNPMPASSLAMVTLGTFILWMGWFGFNGGSQLALGSALDASAMAIVFVNTNLGAAGGVVAAAILSQIMFKKIDLTLVLNGALAGLVSITAGPDVQNHVITILIGGVGAVICTFSILALDKLKIDDVVGAISVHGAAGIWGTLAVAFNGTGNGNIVTQAIGAVAIIGFAFIAALIVFYIMKFTIGLRVSEEDEMRGLDATELGMEAYPEFGSGGGRM